MPLLNSVHLVVNEFHDSSDDPLPILGLSIFGARCLTTLALLLSGAAVWTLLWIVSSTAATLASTSSVWYSQVVSGHRMTGIVGD